MIKEFKKYKNNAKKYLIEEKGLNDYELKKDCDETVDDYILKCPFCGEKQVVRKDDNRDYVCFGCGKEFSERDENIQICQVCGEFFIGDVESGCICPKCFKEKIEKD